MKKYLTLDELFEVIQKSFPIDKKEYLAFINQEKIAPKTKLNGRNMYEQEDSQFVYEHFENIYKLEVKSTIPDNQIKLDAWENEQTEYQSKIIHSIEKMNYSAPQIATLLSENKMKIYRFIDQEKMQPIETKGKTKYYSYEDTIKIIDSIASDTANYNEDIPKAINDEVTRKKEIVTNDSNVERVSDYSFKEKDKVPDVTTIPTDKSTEFNNISIESVFDKKTNEEIAPKECTINNSSEQELFSSNKEVVESLNDYRNIEQNKESKSEKDCVATIPNIVNDEVTRKKEIVTNDSNVERVSDYSFEEKEKVPDVTTIQKHVTKDSNKVVTESIDNSKNREKNIEYTNRKDYVTPIPNSDKDEVTEKKEIVINDSNIERVSDYSFEEKEKVPDITTIQNNVTTQKEQLSKDKEIQNDFSVNRIDKLPNNKIKNNKKYFVIRSSKKQIVNKKSNSNSKNRVVASAENAPVNSNIHNDSSNIEITYLKRENELLRTELNQKNQQIVELSHRLEQEQFLHSRTQGTNNKELPFFKIPEIIEEETKEEEPTQKKALFDKFRKNN